MKKKKIIISLGFVSSTLFLLFLAGLVWGTVGYNRGPEEFFTDRSWLPFATIASILLAWQFYEGLTIAKRTSYLHKDITPLWTFRPLISALIFSTVLMHSIYSYLAPGNWDTKMDIGIFIAAFFSSLVLKSVMYSLQRKNYALHQEHSNENPIPLG